MSAATTTSELPTVLLVHGAWHRPQHYTALTTALQSHYFTVLTPSLESTGTTHAIDTKTHLDDSRAILSILQPALDAGKQIIAVAHSYGTLPLAEALAGQSAEERKERGEIGGVVGVVFIAPLPVLKKGVSMLEAGGGEWASGFFHGVTETRLPLFPDLAKEAFYSGLPAELQEEAMKLWVEQSARPFYVAIEHTPADLRAPKTLVVCTEDKIFPMDLQVLCAETWGANQVEVKTGHSPWMNAEARKKIVATIRDHAEKTRA